MYLACTVEPLILKKLDATLRKSIAYFIRNDLLSRFPQRLSFVPTILTSV